MKFVIQPSGIQWYFTIVARNGRTLATSETYWNKSDAISAAKSIIDEGGDAPIVG